MNIMDILVLAIMGISVFFGFRKGFLKTITGFASIILSLILATSFHPYVSTYLRETTIYESVYQSSYSVLQISAKDPGKTTSDGTAKLNLPREFTEDVKETIDTAADTVSMKIAEKVADAAISILAMLLLFVGIRLLLLLISWLIGLIVKLPIIGWGDSLLGALFGLLRGFLIIYLALAVAFFAVTVSPQGVVAKSVRQSSIAKIMYHDNVLLEFVYKN